MSDETILYLAYGLIAVILIIFGLAMWSAGKDE